MSDCGRSRTPTFATCGACRRCSSSCSSGSSPDYRNGRCSRLPFALAHRTGASRMKSRAAVAWEAGKPLEIELVDVEGPRAGEVLLQVIATGVCHTDAYTL